jgi:hypothetical protein
MRIPILALVVLSASPALAQDRDYDSILGIHLRLGFAGGLTYSTDAADTETDLDTTLGIGLRAEVPVLKFLSIGGLFEAAAYQTDIPFFEDDTRWGLDFDFFVRGRYLFVFEDVAVEPYVALPIGFSLGFLQDPDSPAEDEAWPGWNVGVLGGIYVISKVGIGGLFELGWRHHEAYNSNAIDDLAVSTNELAMNVGAVFALW